VFVSVCIVNKVRILITRLISEHRAQGLEGLHVLGRNFHTKRNNDRCR
jgi:hypothetical protein